VDEAPRRWNGARASRKESGSGDRKPGRRSLNPGTVEDLYNLPRRAFASNHYVIVSMHVPKVGAFLAFTGT
jgi:hypothetical protein